MRTGTDCINDYRGASRYGNNKKQEYRESEEKTLSPVRLGRQSTLSSSFDTNDEIEIRTTSSKERSISARHYERIGTRDFKSSNSGKSIRTGKTIHKNMKTIQDRDYYMNGDRFSSSFEDTTKKSHRDITTNTVNRELDTHYSFVMMIPSSKNGESEPKGYKSNARPKIDPDRDGNTKIDVLRRNVTLTNTTQHDRENIDYFVASNDQKKDMINDNNTNHINCKRNS